MDGLQLDLASVILRIEQAYADPELRDFLLHRLATCDVPRLRRYLDAETLATMGMWACLLDGVAGQDG